MMFIVVLFIMGQTWKQSKNSLTEEWINKLLQSHHDTMEHYSTIKTNKLQLHVAICMNLNNIIVNEKMSPRRLFHYRTIFIVTKFLKLNNKN